MSLKPSMQLLEAGADFEAQTSTGERALHMAIMRMDVRILASLLDVGADSKAPSLQMWHGSTLKTPQEMCEALPSPYSEQVSGVLKMTVKQRANLIEHMEEHSSSVNRREISSKIHVNNGVRVHADQHDEPY